MCYCSCNVDVLQMKKNLKKRITTNTYPPFKNLDYQANFEKSSVKSNEEDFEAKIMLFKKDVYFSSKSLHFQFKSIHIRILLNRLTLEAKKNLLLCQKKNLKLFKREN